MSEDLFCTALVEAMLHRTKPPILVRRRNKPVATWDWAESVYEFRVTVRIYIASMQREVVVETARCEDGGEPPPSMDGWQTHRGVVRQSWTVPQTAWLGDPSRLAGAVANILRFALRDAHTPVVGMEPSPLQGQVTSVVKRFGTRKLNLGGSE